MIRKKVFCIFIFWFSLSVIFGEDEKSLQLFSFGPETDEILVLCFTQKNNYEQSELINNLKSFIKNISVESENKNLLNQKVIIAISHNDYTDLPSDVEVQSFVGMNELTNKIIKYKQASVFIFDEDNNFNITYKTREKKSPAWMLKLFFSSIKETGLQVNSKIFSLDDGATQSMKALDVFFTENIPALHIEILPTTNIEKLISNLSYNYPKYFSKTWEQNFFLLFNFGNIKIISERTIVIFTEVLLFLIFFNLFMQSIISKKNTGISSVKKFFTNASFYFILVMFNLFCILIAKFITGLIYKNFLGANEVITEFNIYYIIIFIATWIFEVLFIQSIATFVLKKSNFDFKSLKDFYPMLCFVNFFVLSILDFSIFIFAFITYALSNFYYLTKKIFSKTAVLLLTFIPTIVYFFMLIGNINTFIILITKNFLFFTVITLPIIFIINAIYFISKKYFKRKIFITLASILVISLFATLTFYFAVKKSNTPIEIRQVFNNGNNNTTIRSNYIIHDDLQLINLPNGNINSTDYIAVESRLENYLDRSVGTIKIKSPVKVEAVQVEILNRDGIAIYEADKSFTADKTVKFISSQKPSMPFEINFSSEKNANLEILVKIFSYENKYNTKLKNSSEVKAKNYFQDFLLEANYKFDLKAK